MLLFGVAVLAGGLTVLSPCSVSLLPGVVAPAMLTPAPRSSRWVGPAVIALSLGGSVAGFTLVLKWLTVLAGVDPIVWRTLSAALLLALGVSLLLPGLWDRFASATGIARGAHRGMAMSRRAPHGLRWVLTGAALGPVFSSCSPVYAFVLAAVLPVDPGTGVALVLGYGLGLALTLFVVAVTGRALIRRLGWASAPDGALRRVVGGSLIITGLIVGLGWQRALEDGAGRLVPSALTRWEAGVLDPGGATPARMSDVARRAPEFVGLEPLEGAGAAPTLAALRGQVVLVDFWTFGCVNCRNTQSHLNAWHDAYAARGLRIVGVHAPEFAHERERASVQRAVTEAGIRYDVALDNGFETWRAFGVRAWPTMVFIDRGGQIRHVHIGEGDYDNSAAVIEALLAN